MKKSLLLITISIGLIMGLINCGIAKKRPKNHGKAIIHGSPNQEKLDSLKLEKEKGKS